MDFYKTPKEKARWELHKDAAYCFEQILKAATYKAAGLRLLTTHHTSHPKRVSKIRWAPLMK